MSCKKVGVVGAGTMGNGIAHVFAASGFDVILIDMSDDQLKKAVGTIEKNLGRMVSKEKITEEDMRKALENIRTSTELESCADREIVIEAVFEDEKTKFDIFGKLDKIVKPEYILASNTSSISITSIGAATGRPEKVIGMHFMNPVPMMKLVEIVRGMATSDETYEHVKSLGEQVGKTPVEAKDYPGFISNRILMPMINEAVFALEQGVGTKEDIDTVMKLGMAHPMGPLQLADFIGLDVCLSILRVMHEGFGNPKYAPCPLLVNMVTAGRLGIKSGEGFYAYTPGSKDLVVSESFRN
jgi:3-hydroxybutyryl-CoA dehydrogenase